MATHTTDSGDSASRTHRSTIVIAALTAALVAGFGVLFWRPGLIDHIPPVGLRIGFAAITVAILAAPFMPGPRPKPRN